MIESGLMAWIRLISELAERAEREFGGLGPFTARSSPPSFPTLS